MLPEIENFQSKRRETEKRDDSVIDVLREGRKKAKEVAQATVEEVKKAIFG
jgi:tryptophanyl-tRNA synthetase